MPFSRNIPSISEAQQDTLRNSHVLVLGCGGLGGYIIENLARLGVGEISAADGDSFEESNLNRQTLCTWESLGWNKAHAARARAAAINPLLMFHPIEDNFSRENAAELLKNVDLVICALDSVEARLLLEDCCSEAGLTIVHGAVRGWSAQVCCAAPGAGTLRRLYGDRHGDGQVRTCLAPTCSLCAAVQCSEAVKLLCGIEADTVGRLFMAELDTLDFNFVDIV